MSSMLRVAVIGHTNTGKTSLLRTLLRDSSFGEISSRPGTTRHVEAAELLAGGEPVMALYDTPGLEDSIGLLTILEQLGGNAPAGGIDAIRRFLVSVEEFPRFQQEAKVLRQLLDADLVFYVVDSREPLLGKYLDELKVLAMAAKPVLPVLNFIAEGIYQEAWRQQFARLGLHAVVAFDTVVYDREGEKRLYQKMQSLTEIHYEPLQKLIDEREQDWLQRYRAGARRIAELLVNVASYRVQVNLESQQNAEDPAVPDLQNRVRMAEQDCVRSLTTLFRFADQKMTGEDLPVDNGEWELDLFDSNTLKMLGVQVGGAAAKGAALGAGIDLLTGGLSLGAATGLGALLGATWGAGRRRGLDLAARLKGYRYVCVDEATLVALWLRQAWLLRALAARGHASQQPLAYQGGDNTELPESWSAWLRQLRAKPEWSTIAGTGNGANGERAALVNEIAARLQRI